VVAGAAGPIPASSPELAAGEGLGKGLGCSRRRFAGLDRAEVLPAAAR
jgi:hypothetical protein